MMGDAAGESAVGRLTASRASALQAAKFSAFGTDVGPVEAASNSAAMIDVMSPSGEHEGSNRRAGERLTQAGRPGRMRGSCDSA